LAHELTAKAVRRDERNQKEYHTEIKRLSSMLFRERKVFQLQSSVTFSSEIQFSLPGYRK